MMQTPGLNVQRYVIPVGAAEFIYLCADIKGPILWARVSAEHMEHFLETAEKTYNLVLRVYDRPGCTSPWRRLHEAQTWLKGFNFARTSFGHPGAVLHLGLNGESLIVTNESLSPDTRMHSLPTDFRVMWVGTIDASSS